MIAALEEHEDLDVNTVDRVASPIVRPRVESPITSEIVQLSDEIDGLLRDDDVFLKVQVWG